MKKTLAIMLLLLTIKTGISQNVFPSSGNVGIGTLSPTEKLTVNGNQFLNGYLKFPSTYGDQNDGTISNSRYSPGLDIVGINDDNTYRKIQLWGEITQNQNVGINRWMGPNSFSGNVSIGTTNTEQKLLIHEANTAKDNMIMMTHAGVNKSTLLIGNANSSYIVTQQQNSNIIESYTDLHIGAANSGSIIFETGRTNEYAPLKMILTNSGNLGIGVADPTEKLSVNGNIRTRKVIVTQTGWPDYVFEPTYQLPSLDSVHNFIKANKHLPEIPTAKAIEKDGHDLGEVQKLLLKKVEELTLYIIEQNKRIEKQQIIIETLSQRVELFERSK